MRVPPEVGTNRTGTSVAPGESKQAIEGAREASPSAPGDASALAAVRAAYIQAGEPVGLMPASRRPTVLLDRLGERLAFERIGTRLFEALITKYEAADVGEPALPDGPTLAELRVFHDDELAHFELMQRAIESLGGDPTVQTPSADIAALAVSGVLQVVADPRATAAQSLQALLVAELVDHDGWRQVTELVEALGHKTLAEEFRRALRTEERHLAQVRRWLAADLRAQAGAAASTSATGTTSAK